MFKIGDYVVGKDKGVFHLTSYGMLAIVNAAAYAFRYATQEEIEKYHWEEFE